MHQATAPLQSGWDDDCSCYLIVVVIQVRISALELHHLDARHPLLLLLGHQVTIGVPAPPIPSSATTVTDTQTHINKQINILDANKRSMTINLHKKLTT